MKGHTWQQMNLERIISVGTEAVTITGPVTKPANARLWRILISESTHLIWRLQCEHVIGHEDTAGWTHSEKAVTTKWINMMNSRMRQDIAATNPRFGRQALHARIVQETWEDLVLPPPDHWRGKWVDRVDRVLVGINHEIVAEAPID